MEPNHPLYFALQSLGGTPSRRRWMNLTAAIVAAAEAHRRALAERVTVQTPDPFINAAVAALCVAADAVWDSSLQYFMHGAGLGGAFARLARALCRGCPGLA